MAKLIRKNWTIEILGMIGFTLIGIAGLLVLMSHAGFIHLIK